MRRKFSEEALKRCGLFFVRDDAAITLQALRPRFRGRLMIPIRDHQGRVCAFTARQTGLTPDDDPAKEAKYVNSPETPIFTKGNLLFNLDRARTHVGEGKPFVMVEGQLDALRCWSVGLKTAIAPQGTSITESQLVLLRRYHTQVECFFDSDSAGQKAALRFLPMALKAGLELRFLTLAGATKLDPDLLFLERGLAAYEEVRRGGPDRDGIRQPCDAERSRRRLAGTEGPRRAGTVRDHRQRRERGCARGVCDGGRLAPPIARRGGPERFPSLSGEARTPERRPAEQSGVGSGTHRHAGRRADSRAPPPFSLAAF
jgi:hypothetical protein